MRPNKIITPHAHAYKCNDYCKLIDSFIRSNQSSRFVSIICSTTVFALRISVTQRYQLIYNSGPRIDIFGCHTVVLIDSLNIFIELDEIQIQYTVFFNTLNTVVRCLIIPAVIRAPAAPYITGTL